MAIMVGPEGKKFMKIRYPDNKIQGIAILGSWKIKFSVFLISLFLHFHEFLFSLVCFIHSFLSLLFFLLQIGSFLLVQLLEIKTQSWMQGSEQLSKIIFPDFWLKNNPFPLTKVLKTVAFPWLDMKIDQFSLPDEKRHFFHIIMVRQSLHSIQKHPCQFLLKSIVLILVVKSWLFGGPTMVEKFWK